MADEPLAEDAVVLSTIVIERQLREDGTVVLVAMSGECEGDLVTSLGMLRVAEHTLMEMAADSEA